MKTFLRGALAILSLFLLVIPGVACGGSDTAEKAEVAADGAATGGTSETVGKVSGEAADQTADSPGAAAVYEKIKAMAAADGLYFKEVPEGFPLEFIPLHPEGTILSSSVGKGDFGMSQSIPGTKDDIYAWFKTFYGELGWSPDDPRTVGSKTLAGFDGPDVMVSMALDTLPDGDILVDLLLSPM